MPKVSDIATAPYTLRPFYCAPRASGDALRLQTLEALVKQKCVYVAQASRMRYFIASRSARAAAAMDPAPGDLFCSSSADVVMASIIRSFHCDANIVEVASLVASRNAKERSKVG